MSIFSTGVRLGLLAFFSVSLGTAHAFTDTNTSPNGEAIGALSATKVITGYADGTFRPDASVNRAEFLTMVYRQTGVIIPKTTSSCFTDVALSAWYLNVVCYAKSQGVVSGSAGKFRPGDPVSLVEAAKMVAGATGSIVEAPGAKEAWYAPYLRYLDRRSAIPQTLYYVSQSLTRGEVAEIIWRIAYQKTAQPTIASTFLSATPCRPGTVSSPVAGVDITKVQNTWLSWYNAERAKVGAPALVIVPELNKTAQTWADTAKQRGYIDHKRGTNTYYDYNLIKKWFAQQGVTFNGKGTVFGESIAWNTYSCNQSDCTDELIDAIRSSFDFFDGEKKTGGPHYEMMVNKGYKQIGLGIAVDTKTKRYYLVTHLAVSVAGGSLPYCPARP